MATTRREFILIRSQIDFSDNYLNLDYTYDNPINRQRSGEVTADVTKSKHFRHRGGWQTALKSRSIDQLSFPTILSCNCRSLVNKFDDLELLLNSPLYSHTGIVCLQESWLNRSIDDNLITPTSFQCFRNDREGNQRGGGVVTFINNRWSTKNSICYNFSSNSINCIGVLTKPKNIFNHKSLLVVNVYIPPSATREAINNLYDDLIPVLSQYISDSLICVCGDFNQATTRPLAVFGLCDIVNFPTRLDNRLDHLFVSNASYYHAKKRAPLSTSDHNIIVALPKTYGKHANQVLRYAKPRRHKMRNLCIENVDNFREALRETDFSVFFDEDPETHISAVTDYIKFNFDMHCPFETVMSGPRFTSSIHLKRLRRRKEAFSRAGLHIYAKEMSIPIKEEIRRLKKSFCDTLFADTRPNAMWRNIKRLCNSTSDQTSPISTLDSLNNGFISQPLDAPEDIINICHNPSVFIPLTTAEISHALRSLRSSSSCGPDLLPPAALKYCSDVIAPTITDIFNTSLSSGIVPSIWKPVRITPIPKKGSSTGNTPKFRPIANTPVLLKVLESCLLKTLKPQLDESADVNQYAYKSNRSTLDAIATLFHNTSYSLDKGAKIVKCVFLDYSAAFNTIPRSQVLEKLKNLGAPGWTTKWLSDYFTGRTQYVSSGRQVSASIPNDAGVLQGAVLSPFLFAFHLDSLACTNGTLIKYADDLVLSGKCKTSADFNALSDNLVTISQWSTSHGLKLNAQKCVQCDFTLTKSRTPITQLHLDGMNLPCANVFKYLGVTFSSDLTWSAHVENIANSCHRLGFVMKRLRSFSLPQHAMKLFIDSCVLPIILYCSPVFLSTLMLKDYTLLRRSIRSIANISGIAYAILRDAIIARHFSSCYQLAERILKDRNHPLHLHLEGARCRRLTRQQFRLLPARTETYRRSIIPFLARFLNDPKSVQSELLSNLSF